MGGNSRTSAVWNISVDPAVAVNDTGDYDLPRGMQLSLDKTELYLRHGVTLDAMTLEQVNETPLVGNIALDFENGFVYYANYRTVVRLTAEGFEEKGRFCLPWTALDGSYPLTWLVVSHERKLAFALTGHAGNVNTLEAVPLVSEITGLQPPDGWIWDELMWPIRCCLSGDVDPSDMSMWLDGQQVPFRFYEEERIMSYTAPVGLKDGIHQILVEGVDRDDNSVRKEWSFGIDTLPPEIHIFNGEATVRVPEYVLEGQIVDLLFESADIQGEELLVGPDGTFQHRLDLDEGGNMILIRAADSEYRTNSSSTSILYVPPTMRYLSFDGSFSVEYPTSWSYEENYSVGGMSVHVVFLAAVGEGFTSNLNVIHAGELEEYSESHLMDLSNEALDQHSGLPWFHLFEEPTYLEIGGLPSVTFSFSWEANDSSVYQTQYIIADPEYQTSWVLTCTSEYGKYRKYDPLLRWMAETFRVEGAPPEDGDSVDQREDFHLWPVVLAFGLGSLAAALVAVLLFQRSRRKRRMKEPQPPRKKEILGEDDTL